MPTVYTIATSASLRKPRVAYFPNRASQFTMSGGKSYLEKYNCLKEEFCWAFSNGRITLKLSRIQTITVACSKTLLQKVVLHDFMDMVVMCDWSLQGESMSNIRKIAGVERELWKRNVEIACVYGAERESNQPDGRLQADFERWPVRHAWSPKTSSAISNDGQSDVKRHGFLSHNCVRPIANKNKAIVDIQCWHSPCFWRLWNRWQNK